MARKSKTSLEDVVDLVAMLPWWAGLAIGALAYVVLHHYAVAPLPPIKGGTGGISIPFATIMLKGLAAAGQYVLPIACLAAAGLSTWRRRERSALVTDVAQSEAANVLDGMSWREFEMLVGEAFRLQGYRVAETGGGGADGGVDLVLERDGETTLVQCKQWKAFKVGVETVRELYGVMAARGAAAGFVVTSGRFTDEAQRFASGRNVRLIDGPTLHKMIRQAQAKAAAGARPVDRATPTSMQPGAAVNDATLKCPACSGAMTLRKARRGANAGRSFWGCNDYPTCRGTRPAA